jgi:hypothetical protein
MPRSQLSTNAPTIRKIFSSYSCFLGSNQVLAGLEQVRRYVVELVFELLDIPLVRVLVALQLGLEPCNLVFQVCGRSGRCTTFGRAEPESTLYSCTCTGNA